MERGNDGEGRRLLALYLRDRLAAGAAEVELARRALRQNQGPPWVGPLGRALDESRADQRDLEDVARALGVKPDPLKQAGLWVAEKLGRLKLNGRLRGYSPLSRVQEIEGLIALASLRSVTFAALDELHDPRLARVPLASAAERAAGRAEHLRQLDRRAAVEALA